MDIEKGKMANSIQQITANIQQLNQCGKWERGGEYGQCIWSKIVQQLGQCVEKIGGPEDTERNRTNTSELIHKSNELAHKSNKMLKELNAQSSDDVCENNMKN